MLNRSRFIALLSLALAGCATTGTSLAPFKTDGCSLFPDRSLTGRADWCDCCLAHDLAYWRGGTQDERLNADHTLRSCVALKTGNHALAETMFLGVRAGGGPEVNTPFRWGYGWPFGRGYKALTSEEAAAARAKEADYRSRNPTLECKADAAAAGPRAHPSLHAQGRCGSGPAGQGRSTL